MGKKNKAGTNLGRQLIKDRFGHTPRRKVDNDTMVRSKFRYPMQLTNFIYMHMYIFTRSCTQQSCRMVMIGAA